MLGLLNDRPMAGYDLKKIKEDFTERGELYDFIFDAVGKISKSNYKKALTPNGTYVTTNKGIAKERLKI